MTGIILKQLLRLTVRITNNGEVLLPVSELTIYIQQVKPYTAELLTRIEEGIDPVDPGETEFTWPLLVERTVKQKHNLLEVEPSENEEIHFDFFIDAEVEVITVYSHLPNISKSSTGWNKTSYFEMPNYSLDKEHNPKEGKEMSIKIETDYLKPSTTRPTTTDGTKQGPKKERPPEKPQPKTDK